MREVVIPQKALVRLKAAELDAKLAQDRFGKMIGVAAAALGCDPEDPTLAYDLERGIFYIMVESDADQVPE